MWTFNYTVRSNGYVERNKVRKDPGQSLRNFIDDQLYILHEMVPCDPSYGLYKPVSETFFHYYDEPAQKVVIDKQKQTVTIYE